MTGLVRKATLLSVGGLLAASVAMAGVPDPTKTTGVNNPNGFINLTGHTANVVDSRSIKLITVRDAGNNPIANSTVVINFTACVASDIELSNTQPHHPGAFFNCAARTITAVTDPSGIATFRIGGGANNISGNPPGIAAGVKCAEVRADGVLMGNLSVGALDQNCLPGGDPGGGVDVGDQGRFLGDLFPLADPDFARSDYNGDGVVSVVDLGTLNGVIFPLASQPQSSYAVCP